MQTLVPLHIVSSNRTSRREARMAPEDLKTDAAAPPLGWEKEQLHAAAESELKRLSFLSHDLNNNLNAIVLQMQMLKDRLDGLPQFTEELFMLENAQRSIEHTTEGMRRLLADTRLRKSGAQLNIQSLNLHQLASGVCAHYYGVVRCKQLDLSLEIPTDATVDSDGDLIVLVLQNLVGNAVKYSTRGTVRVGAERCSGSPGRYWVVTVSDQGPGIPPEQLEHIFVAFGRGEMRGEQGAGLGLAIAAEAARLLGAELSVETQVGVGSVFRLALCHDLRAAAVRENGGVQN